jgi:hypothetical protein
LILGSGTFDDKKDSEKKVSDNFKLLTAIYSRDDREEKSMHEMPMENIELESKMTKTQAELAKFAEQPSKDDLLKQMGDTLVAQVGQMSQLALKLLGG